MIITTLVFPTVISVSAFAETTEHATDSAEPDGFILFVLGMVALLIGIRNLRQLRTKRMPPPQARKSTTSQKPSSLPPKS